MKVLTLLRHGESVRNKENRFTGWTDVELSRHGIEEATYAGKLISAARLRFDIGYTSVLKRAIKTLWLVLEATDLMWIPVVCHWRLNERHYGALQGLDKQKTREKHGNQQVQQWRRGYTVHPPALDKSDLRYPAGDPRYQSLKPSELPVTESLKDTAARLKPLWDERIAPDLKNNKQVIISAHGNSLRGLIKKLEKLSDEEVEKLTIPTGVPLIYQLDDDLNVLNSYFLENDSRVKELLRTAARKAETAKRY